ncbi:cytosine deaminase [Microvirga massiliensis]|uniref:cytosine deaminase n=1 Tax=Microvirga massiliensis TaxID=1033741 RepID=UPI00062B7842|nr:cytosine deaminase [Microvirga massiliensis]
MAFGFACLPAGATYRLLRARVPAVLVPTRGLAADEDGLSLVDITVESGRIASIVAAGTASLDTGLDAVELDGGIVLPRPVDIHTHLDKGYLWPRRPNRDGTFMSALAGVDQDRSQHWTADDVRTRMNFGLRCAFAHGTGAIRTHLDSIGDQTDISWPVFAELREEWRGRIALQATALFPLDLVLDEETFRHVVATVARHGGLLGGVTFLGQAPDAATDHALDRIFQAADAEGLDVDLHVDESASPDARTLERIARAVIRNEFRGKVLCGHCCSLALQPEAEAERVIDLVAEARLAVVSLPLCNLYLQDRQPRRTPRWRGVVPIHELQAAGVPVMVASDNTRDPFYAYGDLDMIEVFREATRILHFDHSGHDWLRTIAATPADVMGLDRHGRIEAGDAADFVLTRARSLNEFLSRPQSDRMVVVAGRPIDTTLPDYRELDPLMNVPRRNAFGSQARSDG